MLNAGDASERRLSSSDSICAGPNCFKRRTWTDADLLSGAWFAEQADELGLTVEGDSAGRVWACRSTPPPSMSMSSHSDTVADGGRHDGALACAIAADVLLAGIALVAEEGARYTTPTHGSRAPDGRLDIASACAIWCLPSELCSSRISSRQLQPAANDLTTAVKWLT
jgi:hypothetical protein